MPKDMIFGCIAWRRTLIDNADLLGVTVERNRDDEAWSNCTADLSWRNSDGSAASEPCSTTILQRRQELGKTVAEAKQIAAALGIAFVDLTNKKK